MLPYFAASGHNLYAKSGYVYLSQIQNLEVNIRLAFCSCKKKKSLTLLACVYEHKSVDLYKYHITTLMESLHKILHEMNYTNT
jgi:hypothetical protein